MKTKLNKATVKAVKVKGKAVQLELSNGLDAYAIRLSAEEFLSLLYHTYVSATTEAVYYDSSFVLEKLDTLAKDAKVALKALSKKLSKENNKKECDEDNDD